MKSGVKLRFGDLTFDSGRRCLYRGRRPVRLSPKAFQLLELLLSRRPDAVSKAEILDAVWPGVFVSEGSLKVLVKDLRRALGGSAGDAGWIRTVFGFGYAFDGEAVEAPDAAPAAERHVLVWGRQEIGLAEGENVLGRERSSPVWIGHPSVSREHARILVTGERATIEDLGSKNGTWRGSARVSGPCPLFDGDEVRLGEVKLTYRGPATGGVTRTKSAG